MTTIALEARADRTDGAIAALRADLGRARLRAAAFRVVGAGAIGLATALAVFCVLRLGALASGGPLSAAGDEWRAPWSTPGGTSPAWEVGVAAAAGAAVFAGAALLGILRNPGVLHFARIADRALRRRERLTTALELSGRPGAALGPVGRALIEDFDIRPDRVDATRLVPFRVPVAAVVGLIALAFAAATIIWVTPAADVIPEPARAPLTTAERESIEADIRRVAALVEADARERNDPYLQAVARGLERLGETIAGDATPDRAEIARELERLLPHAIEGYQRAGVAETAPGNLSRLIEAALREMRPPTAGAPAAADAPAPSAAETAAPRAAGRPPEAAEPAAGQSPPERLGDLLAVLERGEELPPAAMPAMGDPSAALLDDGYNDAAPGDAAFEAERRRAEADAAGRVVARAPMGAAADAGVGEGDAAGEGVRPLENGAVTAFGTPLAAAGEMVLGDPNQGDGRRIRLELPPEAGDVSLRPGERTGDVGWRHLPEREVDRDRLAPGDRGVVQRYFHALTQGGA